MKIILTHTYFLQDDPHEQQIMKPYPPLGLLYLSAFLKKNGIGVSVFDTTFSSYEELIAYLDENRPVVLGIHCNLLTKPTVLKLIRHCRKRGVISILGGPDASTQIREFLKYGADIVISGEGEEPLLKVLKRLETHSAQELHDIPNVSFKDSGGKIVENPRQYSRQRLDDYPFPDRDAIPFEKYLDTWEKYHGQRSVSLITARGCAFTCKWCSHSVYAWTHRRRTPENVVAEIKQIAARYQPTHLWFADDVFTVNKRWILKFHDLMISEKLFFPFECIARADRLDEELVLLLKDLGCYRIWFGAESGSQRILDAMSRGVTREQIQQATQWCRNAGIQAGIFVMFGYPGEALPDVSETIRFVSELQPDHYLTTVAYPLRGTTMYEEYHQKIIYPGSWETHLQRELDFRERFTNKFYYFAIRKLASEYRRRQLQFGIKPFLKRLYHLLRAQYCEFQMKRLAHIKT